jgi:hypothetical protein
MIVLTFVNGSPCIGANVSGFTGVIVVEVVSAKCKLSGEETTKESVLSTIFEGMESFI